MVWQTIVEVVTECTFSITMDLRGQAVKLNHILVDSLSISHGQISEFMLHISDWIMWTKVYLEFQDKLYIVIHPNGMEDRGGVGL